MGCKTSKDSQKESKKIEFDFQPTNAPKVDEFFKEAHDLLQRAEGVRAGLEDTKEKSAELSHAWQLKDPKYTDTIQVLLWSISAQNEGKIEKADVETSLELPYLTADATKISGQTLDLYQNFTTYMKTLKDGPATVKEVLEKVTSLVPRIPDIFKDGKTFILENEKEGTTQVRSISKLTKNAEKLKKEVEKCKRLAALLEQSGIDMKEVAPKINGLINTADEVGAKAFADNITTPGEIFDKYHTGAKKTEQEVQTEKKTQ